MTDEAIDLDELERLEWEATEGPWRLDQDGNWRAFRPMVPAQYVGEFDGSVYNEKLALAARNAAPELLRRARRLERCERFLREHGDKLIAGFDALEFEGIPEPLAREALAALMKEIEK